MVRRDYGNWCSVFEFRAAEPNVYGDGGWANLRLKPGDPVQIILGGVQVINGNVTTRQASFDAQSHELVIAGKSLTQNLHSSVVVKPGNYNGNTFEQATRGVLGPVGLNLSLVNPPSMASKPFTSLAVQFGESVGEFVERIAKMRGLFLTDDENGNLVASQVDPSAAAVAELEEGRNILRATCKLDDQSLWSGLSVVGQQTGNDQNWPPRDNSATVQNPNGPPNRTQIIAAEHPADATDLQQRANFEAAHSSWPVVEAQITVVGWKKDDGSLWVPTENVTVYSPTLFPNETGSITLGHLGLHLSAGQRERHDDGPRVAQAASAVDASEPSNGHSTRGRRHRRQPQPGPSPDRPAGRRLMRSNTLDAARRAYLGLVRGTVNASDDSPMMQTVDARLMHNELLTGIERFQPYGMSSVPRPPDSGGKAAEVIVGFLHGNRGHPIVLGVDDRRYRPKNWMPGDVGNYHYSGATAKFADAGWAYNGGTTKLSASWTIGNLTVTWTDGKALIQIGGSGGPAVVVTPSQVYLGGDPATGGTFSRRHHRWTIDNHLCEAVSHWLAGGCGQRRPGRRLKTRFTADVARPVRLPGQ